MEGREAGRGLHAPLRAPPGKPRRLASLISRYYDAIEADFAREYPGTDPGALWRDRKWGKLLNLIDHLPFNSYLKQAQLNDPEYAALLEEAQRKMEAEGKSAPKGHPIHEASPEVRELRALRRDMVALRAVVTSALGGRPSIPPPERLETALAHATEERRKAQHDRLVAKMLPHKQQAMGEGEPPV